MPSFFSRTRTGRAGELWPVFLLLIVVAVPTISVLWFVGVAMENQQLATQQRLTDAYRIHLENVRQQIDVDWQLLLEEAETLATEDVDDAQVLFAKAVDLRLGDAVVLYDDDGAVRYPRLHSTSNRDDFAGLWREASRLENELSDPRAAHEVYVRIANDAETERERITAIQAQLRCLFRLEDQQAARQLVVRLREENAFESLVDPDARSIAANIQLMTIERLKQAEGADEILDSLLRYVNDYRGYALSSPQRLFLMKQLSSIAPQRIDQNLLRAEDLAGRFVAAHPQPSLDQVVRESQIPGVWQTNTPSGRLVILLTEASLRARAMQSAVGASLPIDAEVTVIRPGQEPQTRPLLSTAAGPRLPGWRLSLSLRDSQQIDATATQRNRLYIWTGFLIVLFTSMLAVFIARAFRRQLRLANLKNDLVGTVSHELKTPLSSMRLLVDTLLEEDRLDEQTTRDYLKLIAKENVRLSRLIENFLTFTRMEQDQHQFDFRRLEPAEIVDSAIESAGDRFRSDDCSLDVHVDENLPSIEGDKDSLVTVLLNLLDNAFKYSEAPRQIRLDVTADDGKVGFSVSDNGIGLSRTASRRVFQRFFQVDQSLARDGGGCGLGLSIVNSIVKAHRGAVHVRSNVAQGSTFTVEIPCCSTSSTPTTAVMD